MTGTGGAMRDEAGQFVKCPAATLCSVSGTRDKPYKACPVSRHPLSRWHAGWSFLAAHAPEEQCMLVSTQNLAGFFNEK